MRDHWRPLLVFADSLENPEFVHQMDELRAHPLDIKDRDILVIPVISRQSISPNLFPGLSVTALPAREVADAMSRFNVSPGSFQVVLVGKDGSSKLSSKVPVPVRNLNELIDSMPMRKREKRLRKLAAPSENSGK